MKSIRILTVGMLAILAATTASAETKFLNSGKVVKGDLPFSEAVQVDKVLYLSGQVGLVADTQKLAPGGIEAETRQTMDNIKTVVEAHGYSMGDVVKCTVFLADLKEWPAFNDIYKGYFKPKHYPARSAVQVSGLALGSRVEVECMAVKS
ncbi:MULTISPECIES: RidA family protein [unclassified Pseudomonas]|uniref:RidA family protein n=1 Tax=unclassified Pseudomonas TaxID=196821 RepID=UPI000D8362A1|nr:MULTISPECIES: RidA family protein [unclassified Pseudomonas]PYG78418.1 reactive intermediate/imine deaminase [Pseudomonas sp. RV120224-01c]PYG82640.1 reactive intermediate/imine deaminase [Pseudomonas sp. RV120224-01b]